MNTQTQTLLVVMLASLPLVGMSEQRYGRDAPFDVGDLPEGRFRSELETLPPGKQVSALAKLHKVSFTDLDLDTMHLDQQGDMFVADTVLPPKQQGGTAASSGATTAQAIGAGDAFTLHSKPGASNVIYLDFDGATIANTAWNASSGVASYSAVAFDTDGVIGSFSSTELSQIQEVWHRIAEDYAPFNVDVTTEKPGSFGPTIGTILITRDVDANGINMPSYGAGGVAYVNVWGASNYASYYSPALVYYNQLGPGYPPYIAEAAAHEMGHNLSLSHDGYNNGTTSQGYFAGMGSGNVSWAPIMGVGYYQNVTEWSKGEYPYATNFEDDVLQITHRIGARPDDKGNDMFNATALNVDAAGNITATNPETDPQNLNASNKGIIGAVGDVDFFAFDAGDGSVNITVTPAWAAFNRTNLKGANLDIQATLYDANGSQLLVNDPTDDTKATISTTVPAGHYFLKVAGVGNSVTPYSGYDSLGEYFITGTIVPGTAADSTPPTPNPMTFAVMPNAGGSSNSITMQASTATDDSGGAVQYDFVCVAGGQGCVESGWQSSTSYIATGLQASTTYSYQVKARDVIGNQTSPSASASATTVTPPDTTAPTPNPMTWASVPSASGTSINMIASTASDASGGVQYHFQCTSGGTGCVDTPWQASNSYSVSGLQAGVTYTYQVQAKDAVGNMTAFSVVKSATTTQALPAQPTNLTATKTTTVNLSWGAVSNATSYEIFRCTVTTKAGKTSCSYGTKVFKTVNTNSYSYAASSTVYGYKVRAVNSAGKSAFSNEVRI